MSVKPEIVTTAERELTALREIMSQEPARIVTLPYLLPELPRAD